MKGYAFNFVVIITQSRNNNKKKKKKNSQEEPSRTRWYEHIMMIYNGYCLKKQNAFF